MKSKMLTGAALEVNIHDDNADVGDKKDCDDGKNYRGAIVNEVLGFLSSVGG